MHEKIDHNQGKEHFDKINNGLKAEFAQLLEKVQQQLHGSSGISDGFLLAQLQNLVVDDIERMQKIILALKAHKQDVSQIEAQFNSLNL